MGERPEEAAQGPAPRIDALRVLPQGHEHLLGDVLGGLPVDERPHGEPVDEAGVAVVQVDEGRLVAAGQTLDQDPLRPRGLMPFVHEASPLHGHRSKLSAEADHPIRAGRARLRRAGQCPTIGDHEPPPSAVGVMRRAWAW